MRIKQILTQHRNDFTAVLVCEHCNLEQKLTTGYNDSYYHENVIPNMVCKSCKKPRTEEGKQNETLPEIGS